MGQEAVKWLSVLSALAGYFSYWLFLHVPTRSPGQANETVAYANMAILLVYFCAFCWGLYADKWIVVAALVLIYPLIFVGSNPHNLILSPKPGDSPYLDAILRVRSTSWATVLKDPWVVLPSDWPPAHGPFYLSQLYRTKMPGFALTAKVLSYIIGGSLSFLLLQGTLAVGSILILRRVFLR